MTISRVYSGNTTGIHKYLIRNRDKKRGKQKTKIWTIELRQKHDESEESNCVDKLERSSGVVIGQEREREREREQESLSSVTKLLSPHASSKFQDR